MTVLLFIAGVIVGVLGSVIVVLVRSRQPSPSAREAVEAHRERVSEPVTPDALDELLREAKRRGEP